MAPQAGLGLVTLRDSDALPESVVLSDFRGRRNFYTVPYRASIDQTINRVSIGH